MRFHSRLIAFAIASIGLIGVMPVVRSAAQTATAVPAQHVQRVAPFHGGPRHGAPSGSGWKRASGATAVRALSRRAAPVRRAQDAATVRVPAGAGVRHIGDVAPTAPSQLIAFQGTSQAAARAAYGQDQAVFPPDPNMTAGPNDLVEATNSALYFFHKDGTVNGSMDINTLVQTPTGWTVSDPRVAYDPSSGRFYFTVLLYDISTCASEVILLRTDSGDPTASWNGFVLFNVAALSGASPFADQPGLGFSNNVLAVTWNYYACSGGTIGSFQGSELDIVQKSDLLNVAAGQNSVDAFVPGPFGLQPAVSIGSTNVQYLVFNNSDPVQCGSTPSIGVFPVTGTPEQQNVTTAGTGPCGADDETITPTAVDSVTGQVESAAQMGSAALLQTDDDRLLTAVWQGGQLWTAGTTNCQPTGDSVHRACLNVISVPADTGGSVGAATQHASGAAGFVGVNGSYLFYPSITVDSAGNAYVVFDESSATTNESVQVAAVIGGAVSGFDVLHTSSGAYNPGGCPAIGCRWGDYSGAVQDPSHPTDVWVVSEDTDNNVTGACTAPECWNTYIGRYTLTAPSIANLTPAAGPVGGGQAVTVNGSDFLPGTTATLGGAPVTVAGLAPDSFTFTTSAHAAGYVSAQATDGLGSSATDSNSGYVFVGTGSYVPLTPFRILDTRPGPLCIQCGPGPLLPGTVRTLNITSYTDPGTGESVPATATAVVLNVTAVDDSSFSLLTVFPTGTGQPLASNLNFNAFANVANLVTVTLGRTSSADTNREVNIFNALGTLDVVADVEGYFAPPSGTAGEFHSIVPLRVCDTRASQPANTCNGGPNDHTLGPGGVMKVNVTLAQPGIPADGTEAAAALNLTAVSGTANTYLSLYPTRSDGTCATATPAISTINVGAFANQANRVFVLLGPDAPGGHPMDVCVYNSLGSINMVIDANGWFGSSTAPAGTQFQPIGPSRICDTRAGQGTPCSGTSLSEGGNVTVTVTGVGGIPSSGPLAIIANVTAVNGTKGTFFTVYPADATRPTSSDLNVSPYANLPNLDVVQLSISPPGQIKIYNSLGTIDVVIDVDGWFQ